MSEMLTCRQLIEFLLAYVEEELSPEMREEFDRHLALCPPCVNYVDTYRETVRLGKLAHTCEEEATPEEVPERLIKAVLEARRREKS